jgi:hypothetical protein
VSMSVLRIVPPLPSAKYRLPTFPPVAPSSGWRVAVVLLPWSLPFVTTHIQYIYTVGRQHSTSKPSSNDNDTPIVLPVRSKHRVSVLSLCRLLQIAARIVFGGKVRMICSFLAHVGTSSVAVDSQTLR